MKFFNIGSDVFEKSKVIIITFVMLAIISIGVFLYFESFMNYKNRKVVRVKTPAERSLIAVQKEADQQEVLQTEKRIEKYQDNFAKILLVSNSLEYKLYFGGNIEDDILKLKTLSTSIDGLQQLVYSVDLIKSVQSRDEILAEFNLFVREYKAHEIAKRKDLLSKIIGFFAKYIVVLNKSSLIDAKLLAIEDAIKKGEFYSAMQKIQLLEDTERMKSRFMLNLQNSAKLEEVLDGINNKIAEKLQ
jgi:hypothetical protein